MARNAMQLLHKFDIMASQIPELYLYFYGRIAWRFEPIQLGGNYCRQAFEAGLSNGNIAMSFHCAIQAVKNSFFSGTNLRVILKEIDYYLHLLETYKCELAKNYMLIFRETVSFLIDDGAETSIAEKAVVGEINDASNKMRDAVFFHSAIRAYFTGHNSRSLYFSEKYAELYGQGGNSATYVLKLYHGERYEGLNLTHLFEFE
jgi:hypothetical protein